MLAYRDRSWYVAAGGYSRSIQTTKKIRDPGKRGCVRDCVAGLDRGNDVSGDVDVRTRT